MKTCIVANCFLFLLITCAGFARGTESFEPNTVTLKFSKSVGTVDEQFQNVKVGVPALDRVFQELGVQRIQKKFRYNPRIYKPTQHDLSRIYVIQYEANLHPEKVAFMLEQMVFVDYAEVIPKVVIDAVPDDEYYSVQQHLPQISAEAAWDLHLGENGIEPITIGIIDDAVLWTHPDLVDNVHQNLGEDVDGDGVVLVYENGSWIFDPDDENGIDDDGNGYADDFIGWDFHHTYSIEDNNPLPDWPTSTHGTHCSGIAAGVTNNETGISSISWNLDFMFAKLSGGDIEGGWDMNRMGDAMIYLAENGADVISCSFGVGNIYMQSVVELLRYVNELGTIVVASAGNESGDFEGSRYLSDYPGVISVAAVSVNDIKTSYSNWGIGIDLSAPGGEWGVVSDFGILSTVMYTNGEPGYDRLMGTSMSAPMAAGLLALIKSQHPEWGRERVLNQFLGTCDNIDALNPTYAGALGSGRINAERALSEENAEAPQILRLQLEQLQLVDGDEDGVLEAGELVDIGLSLRNYTHVVSVDDLTLNLSCSHPDIEIITSSLNVECPADTQFSTSPGLQIRVSEGFSGPQFVELEFQLSSSQAAIAYGETLVAEILVAPSGILVFEAEPDGYDYSGSYIRDELELLNLDVLYTNTFPSSLMGFDAVFLSWGGVDIYWSEGTFLSEQQFDLMLQYIANGGKLYTEGGSTFFVGDWAGFENMDLVPTHFGLDVFYTNSMEHEDVTLTGQSNSLAEGMYFPGTNQTFSAFMSTYVSLEDGAQMLFREADNSGVAFQFEGAFAQQVIVSNYALMKLQDGEGISTRRNLLHEIIHFFELPYLAAELTADTTYGHIPLTVNFSDMSTTSDGIISWAWDLDGDGITDSELPNPEFVYDSPGDYSVSLTVGDGNLSSTKTVTALVSSYEDEVALAFQGGEGIADCGADESLHLQESLTLEGWFKPTANDIEDARIFDKSKFRLEYVNYGSSHFNDGSLGLTLLAEENGRYTTPPNSITPGVWQHIAMTHDAANGTRLYIDGEDQTMVVDSASGAIDNHTSRHLFLGNNISQSAGLIGALDEVRVWSTARSQEEILELMHVTLTGSPQNLVGYWKMNEGEGDTLQDASQYGNHALLESAGWGLGAPDLVVSVAEQAVLPEAFTVKQNYPNPFNPSTHLELTECILT